MDVSQRILCSGDVETVRPPSDLADECLSGNTALPFDGCACGLPSDTKAGRISISGAAHGRFDHRLFVHAVCYPVGHPAPAREAVPFLRTPFGILLLLATRIVARLRKPPGSGRRGA